MSPMGLVGSGVGSGVGPGVGSGVEGLFSFGSGSNLRFLMPPSSSVSLQDLFLVMRRITKAMIKRSRNSAQSAAKGMMTACSCTLAVSEDQKDQKCEEDE